MKETQILRGLHKARAANRFYTGMVPEPPANTTPMGAQDQAAFNNLQDTPVATAAAPAQPASEGAKRRGAVGGGDMLGSYNPIAMPQIGLSRGTAYLHGPGTATSDSIPARLSKGEAVLPAKTVAKVGVENLARLIQQTNGKPPARGLKAGGGYYTGDVPLTDDIVGPRRPQTVNVDAGDLTSQARAQAAKRTAPPMGNTSNATPPPVQETAPAPKSVWQQAKQWGSNQWDAARGRPTPGIAATPAAPVRPSVVKPVLGGLVAGAVGGAAGYTAAQVAQNIGDPSNKPVRANPTETEQVLKIPTGGMAGAGPTPAVQPYNYFTDNETGRNVGNTLSAVSMIPGAGTVARGALGLGAGAISKTLKLAERPLVVGAVQGAAQGVRDVSTAATAPTGTNPFKAENDRKLAEHAAREAAAPQLVTGSYGRQYMPGAITQAEHDESDRLLSSVRGKWGANSNDKGLRAGALETVNKAWALRGSGIKATMDPRGNGLLVLSNSNGPEKMPYVGADGKPTDNWKNTTQYQDAMERKAAEDKAAGARGLQAEYDTLMNTPMGRNKRSVMAQALQARMQNQTATEANAIQREHNQLTAQSNQARLGLERAKYTGEMQREGSKSFDEYLKNDPSMYLDDPEGKKPPSLDERALARKRSYIAQTLPTVKIGDREMSLDYAFAHHPREAKAFAQQASNEHTLAEFANKYSKQSALGKGVAPGRVAVVDGPRPAELADLAANMHMGDYLETKLPWINDQRVQIRGVNGPISVPLKDIINDPNGRAMLETLGRMPVSK